MTDIEWDILDQTYFMNDYHSIVTGVKRPAMEIDIALVELLKRGMLRQLFYSTAHNDYVDLDPYDPLRVSEAHYVITKQGLLAHTGTA